MGRGTNSIMHTSMTSDIPIESLSTQKGLGLSHRNMGFIPMRSNRLIQSLIGVREI